MEMFGIMYAMVMIGFAIRNQWVYNWQREINKAVYKFRMDIVNSWYDMPYEEYEKSKAYFDSLPDYETMCNSFELQWKMFLLFWIWDYKKFIKNEEIFYMFYPKEKTNACETHCGCH
jgi:hypothetical protein